MSKGKTTFIQTIDDDQYAYLEGLAKSRHMTVQAFIKNLVIPDWTAFNKGMQKTKDSLDRARPTTSQMA